MGFSTVASGQYSTAIGDVTTASGDGSTAMGSFTTASGSHSTAMGNNVTTTFTGAFIIGDYNGVAASSSAMDQMTMRFMGGYRLFSNSIGSSGVTLAVSGGAWGTVSDRRKKENFQTINNEDILQKVAALPLSNWNYKSQPSTQRHIGPMAQDFYAAFRLDGIGADTTINTTDLMA